MLLCQSLSGRSGSVSRASTHANAARTQLGDDGGQRRRHKRQVERGDKRPRHQTREETAMTPRSMPPLAVVPTARVATAVIEVSLPTPLA